MPNNSARFEFRAFAQTFGMVAEKIRSRSPCQEIAESDETYLVSTACDGRNVKIRGGRVEIKRLIEERDGLERWEPQTKQSLPVSRRFLQKTFLPALELHDVELELPKYSAKDLLNQLARQRLDLWQAQVFKRRFKFSINGCPTEIDQLLINGAAIDSIAVESEDPRATSTVMDEIGLSEYENVNYPRAIRRIMGLEPWKKERDDGQGN